MSDADITLVAGATGNTGSGVAASLLAKGRRVRALVRDEAKAANLREQGAEVTVVDLDRPETLTESLLDGVTAVYFVTWNGPSALQQSRNLLETITRSGATPHIVRLSGYGTPQSRIISELAKCEDDLKASGLPWTIIKPTFFMQNVMMAASSVKDQGAVYFDWGSGKAGMIDLRDVVDCAVGALTRNRGAIEGETFVLTGPAAIGFADVAEILSRVIGRTVEYVPVPHAAASEAMLGMGVPEWIVKGYAELSAGFEDGFADLTTDNVQVLSGHAPGDFERFARDFAEVFAGAPAVVA
ncbi:MAG: NAD(P)-dependent oxidoreductase [Thermoleophilia bacterium]|nr:NAD(P)-dependent oxidoreductase [Thermoleophilia bacterium]